MNRKRFKFNGDLWDYSIASHYHKEHGGPEKSFNSIYDEGYDDGHNEGYRNGIKDTLKKIFYTIIISLASAFIYKIILPNIQKAINYIKQKINNRKMIKAKDETPDTNNEENDDNQES